MIVKVQKNLETNETFKKHNETEKRTAKRDKKFI